MRTRIFLPLLLSTIALLALFHYASRSAHALEMDGGWQTVGPGIEYQEFFLPESSDLGPNDVYVARMDRSNPNVTIDSMMAQGRLSGGVEQTSGMANRYEGSISFWDGTSSGSWGNRNDVVVAINGYYFGSPHEPPGVPWRGQIHSGWYAKRHDNNENGSGFAWQLDGDAFIGECVYHQPNKQILVYGDLVSDTLKIDDINAPRGEDALILYTPQFDKSTLTGDEGVEVLVEMTRPTMILPPTFASSFIDLALPFDDWSFFSELKRSPEAETVGIVRAIRDGEGSTIIPFDHVVLSATGIKRTKLLENLALDEEIGISQAINHLSKDDCETPITGKDWTKTYASIGGAFYFLEDGLINSFPGDPQANAHDARTAIAYSEDYIFFIVVDQIIFGDDPGDPAPDIVIREGMNMAELGYFAREYVGADFGIAQDGGGSTTMVVNGEVVNVPNDVDSDITIVPCSPPPPPPLTETTFLPLILNSTSSITNSSRVYPTPDSTIVQVPEGEVCYQGTERYVANGMMMVAVEPMTASTVFTPTQIVTTTLTANLYAGPGTNYLSIAEIPSGSVGEIKLHRNELNGVFATGFYWWHVNFGNGLVGWMSESVLSGSE